MPFPFPPASSLKRLTFGRGARLSSFSSKVAETDCGGPRELDAQSDHVQPHEEPLVLLPLEVMIKPLELRFQYHFAGDRPTNKLDKVSIAGQLVS